MPIGATCAVSVSAAWRAPDQHDLWVDTPCLERSAYPLDDRDRGETAGGRPAPLVNARGLVRHRACRAPSARTPHGSGVNAPAPWACASAACVRKRSRHAVKHLQLVVTHQQSGRLAQPRDWWQAMTRPPERTSTRSRPSARSLSTRQAAPAPRSDTAAPSMLALWSTLAVSIGAVSNGSAGSGCRCGRSAETSAPTVEVAVADIPIVVAMISMGQMLIQLGHRRHDRIGTR